MIIFWLCSILVPIWLSLFFHFKCNKKYGICFAVVLLVIVACFSGSSNALVGETIMMVFGINILSTVIFCVIASLLINKTSEKTAIILPLILTGIIMFVFIGYCKIENENREMNNLKRRVDGSFKAQKALRESKFFRHKK